MYTLRLLTIRKGFRKKKQHFLGTTTSIIKGYCVKTKEIAFSHGLLGINRLLNSIMLQKIIHCKVLFTITENANLILKQILFI